MLTSSQIVCVEGIQQVNAMLKSYFMCNSLFMLGF